MSLEKITSIAMATHEANRAYCLSIGDTSQPHWEDAPDWQKESAQAGVRGILEGRIRTPEESHDSWLEHKLRDGWAYGPTKDPEQKLHPCMLPYAELPDEQRAKDAIYHGLVRLMAAAHGIAITAG